MIRIRSTAMAAVVALAGLVVAGCASSTAPHPAGPPRAGALAARLGCQVTGTAQAAGGGGAAAYDTVQYVVASGGQCSDGSKVGPLAGAQGPGIDIITFASRAKEADWLHQNAAAESASSSGYLEVVSGRLWVIASDGYGVLYPARYVMHTLGGTDVTF